MNNHDEKMKWPQDTEESTDTILDENLAQESFSEETWEPASADAGPKTAFAENAAPPYPPVQSTYYPPVMYPQKEKESGRRVGTVTMACALIALGVLIAITTFDQTMGLMIAGKLAPVILIVLGIEILVRYFFSKGKKLRYDFLSGLICFLLIVTSFGASLVPQLWNQYGPRSEMLQSQLRHEINEICATALAGDNEVAYLDNSVYVYREVYPEQMSAKDLKHSDYVRGDLVLINNFATAEEFAQSVQRILGKLKNANIPYNTIQFSCNDNYKREDREITYHYYFQSALGYNLSIEQILAQTDISENIFEQEEKDEMLQKYEEFATQYWDEFERFLEGDFVDELIQNGV